MREGQGEQPLAGGNFSAALGKGSRENGKGEEENLHGLYGKRKEGEERGKVQAETYQTGKNLKKKGSRGSEKEMNNDQ